MNRKRAIALTLGFFFIIPLNVKAGSFSLNGSDRVNAGDVFSVNVVASASNSIVSSGGNISADGNCLQIIKTEEVSGNVEGNIFSYINPSGKTNITLAKVTLKAKDETCNGYVQVNNGTMAYADSTSEKNLRAVKNVSVVKLSGNNNLKSLSINQGTLSPGFNPNTISYTVKVAQSISSITINGAVEDGRASISGIGTKSLNYGDNRFQINVKAENGAVKTYTIRVNREDKRSSNTNLAKLQSSDGEISFNTNTLEYNMQVPFSVSKLRLVAEAEDSKSKITVNNPDLIAEENTDVTVVVTAENGATKTYTIHVLRGKDPNKVLNTDNNLLNIIPSVGILSPNFNPEQNNYVIYLPFEIETINFEYEVSDKKYGSVEKIGPETLNVNAFNKYVLKVKAEDESINEYTINVFRGKSVNGLENGNAYLKKLILKNGKLKGVFQKNKFHYYYKKGKDFQLDYEKEDENAIVKIIENEQNIYIIVESGDKQVVYHLEPISINLVAIIFTLISLGLVSVIIYDKLLKGKIKLSLKRKSK